MITRQSISWVLIFLCCGITALASRPLLEAFPVLKQQIPHHELTQTLPTPLVPLSHLGSYYGAPHLYYKDDGKTGTPFGGNKVRKLEFLLADAVAHKATAVVTLGGAGSNHALATAAYAQQLGLTAYLLLTPQRITQYARRNLLLDAYVGATIEYFATRELRNTRLLSLLNSNRVYYIPVGGSNELGALGFVNAAFELKQQCDELQIAYPDYLYLPVGSLGTIAGLLVGIKAAGLATILVGVNTDDGPEPAVLRTNIINRARALNDYVRAYDEQFPLLTFSDDDLVIRASSEPYAAISEQTRDALALMRAQEGIQLDTTYSGRAAAVLMHDLAENEDLRTKNILFWKTYADGQCEALTSMVDYHDLPDELHRYFEEPLQAFDDQGC